MARARRLRKGPSSPIGNGQISINGGDVHAYFREGLVEFGLATTDDEHIGALFDEPLGCRKTNTATATCDDGDLAFSIKTF